MDSRRGLILKAFIYHFHPRSPETLFKFLSTSESNPLKSIPLESSDIHLLIYHRERLIQNLHASWIEKLIDKAPESVKPLISSQLPAPFEPFAINILYSLVENPPQIPIEYLPKSELSPLPLWSSEQLNALSDLLGLFDLAAELRFIVDKVSIQNIYSFLSEKEQGFLRIAAQQKESLSVPRLNLDPRKNSSKEWRQIIHQRGIMRIARALNGQNYELIWYIAHKMDLLDGNIILRAFSNQPTPKITPILYLQITQAMNFIKK
jgi:hypothetical protein